MFSREAFREVLSVTQDYAQSSSIHGLRHIVTSGTPFKERVFWLVLVLFCAGFGCNMVLLEWWEYKAVPTETVLIESGMSLENVPFPAIVICPTKRLLQEQWFTYLRRLIAEENYGNVSYAGDVGLPLVNDEDVWEVISGLHLLTRRTLSLAARKFLEIGDDKLTTFNFIRISKFMKEVKPSCETVFHSCLWKGVPFNCCDFFFTTETENGYCYSLDSNSMDKIVSTPGDQCWWTSVNRNAGADSGLRLYLNTSVPPDNTMPAFTDHPDNPSTINNIGSVSVNTEVDRNSVAGEHLVERIPGAEFSFALEYALTETSPELESLPVSQRQCLFHWEWPSYLLPWVPDDSNKQDSLSLSKKSLKRRYTLRLCYHYCRLHYIFEMCGCLPYPFFSSAGEVAECSISELASCLSQISEWLWFFAPPPNTPGFSHSELEMGLNCSQCVPTCASADYFCSTSKSPHGSGLNRLLIAIHFEGPNSASKYKILPSTTISTFLVTMGGIGSLFLGISCLSALEIGILTVKCVWILIGKPSIF